MSPLNYKLSVVVPCYNESGNIPLIFKRFIEVLGTIKDVEVILVNNGSTDDSKLVFEKELALHQDNRFKVADVKVNKGYGYGILSGLKEASGNVLGWTHADIGIRIFISYC